MTHRSLILTFASLIVLATISWLLSARGGVPLALAIACLKASLIALVFMELAHAHPVPRVIWLVGVVFLVLLTAGTLTDVALR
jgi:cytochrome c oxidase subunit 4